MLPPMIPWFTYITWLAGYLVMAATIALQWRGRRKRERMRAAAAAARAEAMTNYSRSEAFRFAGLVKDPEFRNYLSGFGFTSGEVLYSFHPEEPMSNVLAMLRSPAERGWLVVPDPAAPFEMMLLAVGRQP
jgi:hypothetical protein